MCAAGLDYLSTRSTANSVISADAHNLWWLPTLARSEWIADADPLIGPISYRLVGLGLAAVWLALFGVTLHRYLLIGSFAEFWSGTARPLSQQPAVMRDFNLISLLTAAGPLALLALILKREKGAPEPPAS